MYIAKYAQETPEKPALIMANGDTYTFQQFEDRSNQAAQLMRSIGLESGATIALATDNTAEGTICKAGAERAGLRYVCINIHLHPDEFQYIVADAEADVVVCDESTYEAMKGLVERCPNVKRWLVQGAAAEGAFESYDDLIAQQPTTQIDDEWLGSAMLYSSGTTGRPKGIRREFMGIHPKDYPIELVQSVATLFNLEYGMTYLSTAPLYHSAPNGGLGNALRMGATCVVMKKFDPEEFLALVEKYGVTTTQVVPTMLNRIMRLPKEVRDKYDVSSLTTVTHGAAPMPKELKRLVIDEWGPVLYEYYGATEAHGFCAVTSEEWLERPGTVGKAFVGEIVIRDPEGNELPPLEEGTIWFRGATNFTYKGDPERTAQQQSADGNESTVDDVGYVDEDGYLFLTDRKSHMIISGGVNIYPQEIEDLLIMHPEVEDVAVIGIPDEDFGEQVKAVVMRTPSDRSDDDVAASLIEHCKANLAKFKAPRSVDFVDELPRTPTGKLQKKLLRQQYLAAQS